MKQKRYIQNSSFLIFLFVGELHHNCSFHTRFCSMFNPFKQSTFSRFLLLIVVIRRIFLKLCLNLALHCMLDKIFSVQ
ncbi:hypothetical protein Hanom_Chr10g00885551 [Helianthus anomalus]